MNAVRILFLLAFTSSIGLQLCRAEQIELIGSIKCAVSNISLPNTFIRVGDFFTYSNEEGDFILKIPENTVGRLEVSHLGYSDYYCDVHHCADNQSQYKIYLEKVEVKEVTNSSGNEIVMEAFRKMHTNYEMEDQLMQAYCKESLLKKDAVVHFAEGVLEFHIPSNVEKGPTLLRPLKTRIHSNEFHDGINKLSGMATEMVQSWAFRNFLSKKEQWDYRYRLVGNQVYRHEIVDIIDFAPIDNRGYAKGRMWIDEFTHAIIKIEYQLTSGSMLDSEKWVEEFQHNNHIYYLSKSSFEGKWKESGNTYLFKSEVFNTQVKANQEDNISFENFIPVKKFSFASNYPHGHFSDDFWEEHNYIKLTDAEMDLLRH